MTDLERTLAALAVNPWHLVLCWPYSKHPAAPKDAPWPVTRDVDRIRHHVLAKHGNVGLVAGEASQVVILDPDQPAPWAALVAQLGSPARPWVQTGSGRRHFYTAWEPALPAKLVSIDGELIGEVQRGPGQQQALMPPSIHPDTRQRYVWLVDPATEPLTPLPEAWRRWFCPPRLRSGRRRVVPTAPGVDDYARRVAAALAQPGARQRASGIIKFACPACRALGADREQDNAALLPDGRFGCAPVTGTGFAQFHRQAIARVLGLA